MGSWSGGVLERGGVGVGEWGSVGEGERGGGGVPKVMLSGIIKILKERGSMSLAELSLHFQTDVSAMDGMLRVLETKGRIEQLDTKCSRCKGCVEVKPEDAAIFQCSELSPRLVL